MSHTKNNNVRRFGALATSIVAVSMLAACASRNAPLDEARCDILLLNDEIYRS